jgi:hypothetical protein
MRRVALANSQTFRAAAIKTHETITMSKRFVESAVDHTSKMVAEEMKKQGANNISRSARK